jgi:hypothetical protein
MIASIVVGSGNKRTTIDVPRDRDTRRLLANKIKSLRLFPTNASYKKALARGAAALSVA